MKGFTLIEIVIVIAIIGVLTAIVTSKFSSASDQKVQSGIVEGIVAQLEKQKADTQAGKDGSSYGIKFNSDSYILFKGTTYSANSSNNITFPINPNFQITETISNSDNAIHFSRLLGNASEPATVIISHVTDKVSPQTIIIDTTGTISVIE